MPQNTFLKESGKYNFIFLEDCGEFSEKLLAFLGLHYCSVSPLSHSGVTLIHDVSFFNWLFKQGGCLGVARKGEKWVADYPVGRVKLEYHEKLHTVYHASLVCVSKAYRFKGLAQQIVRKTDGFLKEKYGFSVSGVGATGLRVPTVLKNFNMLISAEIEPPKEKIFSSHNFFLVDETSFFTRYSNNEGDVLCYPQAVMYRGNKENWGVIASYSCSGSWNNLIFEAYNNKFFKKFDRVLIFENYERNAKSLIEMGFEKFSSFNLYVDSPGEIPTRYLYYNLFLY